MSCQNVNIKCEKFYKNKNRKGGGGPKYSRFVWWRHGGGRGATLYSNICNNFF